MARIRGRDTTPEVLLRRELWHQGLRYRIHHRTPGGRADLAFVGQKVAIFLDGCFWHGCPDHYVPPRTSRAFWEKKLRDNVARDQRLTPLLEGAGWRVLRFWEHEVFESPSRVAAIIRRALAGESIARGRAPRVVSVEFLDQAGQLERRHLQSLRGAKDLGFVVRERSTKKWGEAQTKA